MGEKGSTADRKGSIEEMGKRRGKKGKEERRQGRKLECRDGNGERKGNRERREEGIQGGSIAEVGKRGV